NTSHHSEINHSPYFALFGGPPRVGLHSTTLPTEILERMVSEDIYLQRLIKQQGMHQLILPHPRLQYQMQSLTSLLLHQPSMLQSLTSLPLRQPFLLQSLTSVPLH